MKLLMVGGDTTLAQGRQGAFYQTLRRFAPYWERIDIICPRAPGSEARTVHGNVHVHPSEWHKAFQIIHILIQGRKLLSEHQYDLIVSHDYGFFYNGAAVWWLSRLSHTPYVSEILHIEGYPRSPSLLHTIYRNLAMVYIRWVWRQVEGIRVMNRVEMPEMLRRLGVPESKILVLPAIYIDFQLFRPMPDQPKRYDVLFIGRLAPNKGILTIVDAIGKVKLRHSQVSLCILGEGPLRSAIEQHIRELGLEKNVMLLDRLSSAEEVACLHNQSRMLVCASTAEGGPRVTVEAMACGVPVVSTPVGVMRELITDQQNGLLFHWDADELAERICLLLDDEGLRTRIAEAGRLSVQEFQADIVVKNYAMGYQNLIRRLRS